MPAPAFEEDLSPFSQRSSPSPYTSTSGSGSGSCSNSSTRSSGHTSYYTPSEGQQQHQHQQQGGHGLPSPWGRFDPDHSHHRITALLIRENASRPTQAAQCCVAREERDEVVEWLYFDAFDHLERWTRQRAGPIPFSCRWLAAHLLDRFLACDTIFSEDKEARLNQLQAIATACCALSVRNAFDFTKPLFRIDAFLLRPLVTPALSTLELLGLERYVLSSLHVDYKLATVLPHYYIEEMIPSLFFGCISPDDSSERVLNDLLHIAERSLGFCIADADYQQFTSCQLAAVCLLEAVKTVLFRNSENQDFSMALLARARDDIAQALRLPFDQFRACRTWYLKCIS